VNDPSPCGFVHLLVSLWDCPDPSRRAELLACLRRNREDPNIAGIHVFLEGDGSAWGGRNCRRRAAPSCPSPDDFEIVVRQTDIVPGTPEAIRRVAAERVAMVLDALDAHPENAFFIVAGATLTWTNPVEGMIRRLLAEHPYTDLFLLTGPADGDGPPFSTGLLVCKSNPRTRALWTLVAEYVEREGIDDDLAVRRIVACGTVRDLSVAAARRNGWSAMAVVAGDPSRRAAWRQAVRRGDAELRSVPCATDSTAPREANAAAAGIVMVEAGDDAPDAGRAPLLAGALRALPADCDRILWLPPHAPLGTEDWHAEIPALLELYDFLPLAPDCIADARSDTLRARGIRVKVTSKGLNRSVVRADLDRGPAGAAAWAARRDTVVQAGFATWPPPDAST